MQTHLIRLSAAVDDATSKVESVVVLGGQAKLLVGRLADVAKWVADRQGQGTTNGASAGVNSELVEKAAKLAETVCVFLNKTTSYTAGIAWLYDREITAQFSSFTDQLASLARAMGATMLDFLEAGARMAKDKTAAEQDRLRMLEYLRRSQQSYDDELRRIKARPAADVKRVLNMLDAKQKGAAAAGSLLYSQLVKKGRDTLIPVAEAAAPDDITSELLRNSPLETKLSFPPSLRNSPTKTLSSSPLIAPLQAKPPTPPPLIGLGSSGLLGHKTSTEFDQLSALNAARSPFGLGSPNLAGGVRRRAASGPVVPSPTPFRFSTPQEKHLPFPIGAINRPFLSPPALSRKSSFDTGPLLSTSGLFGDSPAQKALSRPPSRGPSIHRSGSTGGFPRKRKVSFADVHSGADRMDALFGRAPSLAASMGLGGRVEKEEALPAREGIGAETSIRLKTRDPDTGVVGVITYEPFPLMWPWTDPVSITSAPMVGGAILQANEEVYVSRPWNPMTAVILLARNNNLIDSEPVTRLLVLTPGHRVRSLALFLIHGVTWVAAVCTTAPYAYGLLPLLALSKAAPTPLQAREELRLAFHEEARPFKGGVKKASSAMKASPMQGIVTLDGVFFWTDKRVGHAVRMPALRGLKRLDYDASGDKLTLPSAYLTTNEEDDWVVSFADRKLREFFLWDLRKAVTWYKSQQ